MTNGVIEYMLSTGMLTESQLDGVRFVLTSPYNDGTEDWESDMEQLPQLMDNVIAKNAAWSNATLELRQALQALRDALNAILEGLEP